MRKLLVLAAGMVLLSAGLAQAMDSFTIGGFYSSPIYGVYNSTPVMYGAGSFDPSSLNGSPLAYTYCVDLGHTITPGQTYSDTVVTSTGVVHGSLVNNAIQVAWLLHTYGVNGQGPDAIALQASIWHVIYDGQNGRDSYALDSSPNHASATQLSLYNTYLTGLTGAAIDPSLVNGFSWISPGITGTSSVYQGQVAPVPIPSALLLFGSALLGLVGIGRKLKK